MEGLQENPLTRLVPEAAAYTAPQFLLRDELLRLDAVTRAGAPEAVILYCARILEVLAADALRRLGQVPSANVFSNLQLLEHLNRLGTATGYWAHALRRMGNLIRHITGLVGPRDAALAALFAEGWLEWFFCRFSHGCRLPSLTGDQGPLGLAADDELRSLLRRLQELESGSLSPLPLEVNPVFLETPVLAAVLADMLLGLGQDKGEEALRVLDAALSRFPEDLRLCQLMGLCWSRKGEPEKALQWLEPLAARYEDDETAGITAGAYKRLWQTKRSDRGALEKSQRAYRQAWNASRKKNAYLGINSAATALWLDRREEAQQLAKEVDELLRRRAATLPADLRDSRLAFNYWDQVTLAEAQLLQGDWETARRTYEEAFALHAGRRGDIEVSRKQRDEILQALRLPRPEN